MSRGTEDALFFFLLNYEPRVCLIDKILLESLSYLQEKMKKLRSDWNYIRNKDIFKELKLPPKQGKWHIYFIILASIARAAPQRYSIF